MNPDRKRILIVDDVESNRILLAAILHTEYAIDHAVHGQDALKMLTMNAYSALLLDLNMPVLDGISTLKIIRQSMSASVLPVIIVSAVDDYSTIMKAIELGANDYLTKPVDPSVVRARLSTQIALQKMADDTTGQSLKRIVDALFSSP